MPHRSVKAEFSYSCFGSISQAGLKFESRYYEGGISSVYLWDQDVGFAGVVLLKKSVSSTFVLHLCSNGLISCS